ncbi:MAG: hypothetical protein ABI162_10310 [Luteolibacter sp.]
MVSKTPKPPMAAKLPVFAISCWVLALMAFVQLLVAGMALATKLDESRQVRIVEKEVPKTIVIRVPATAASPTAPPSDPVVAQNSVVSRPPVAAPVAPPVAPPALVPAVAPTPMATPKIADPRTERLVKEGRQARVAGDMGLAVMKLEEALTQSPEDPNVHYEMGLVHEQMGVFDVSSAHFEKVFQMGATVAGSLYELAAAKLRDGPQDDKTVGQLSLGKIRIFNDAQSEDGQRVILTIPVQKDPAKEIDVSEIAVSVTFFNRNSKGEIVMKDDRCVAQDKWVTLPFDWAGGEEDLRMTYVIPPQDAQTDQLFGKRSYYGQVVTLSYKGEVLDLQAWPAVLATKIGQQPPANPNGALQPEFQDTLPPDFDPNVPLLPPLKQQPLVPELPRK